MGLAFASGQAGRALSAHHLVVFGGVFVVQSGMDLMIDAMRRLDWGIVQAYQGALGVVLLACNVLPYVWFLKRGAAAPAKFS